MLNKDLKDIKEDISKIKHPKLNKIFESEKIDVVIDKVLKIYHNITDKLIVKYNLEDELKQGKIFTILIAIISLVLLIISFVFFTVALNSIIGIGLVFSFFSQVLFCLKWGYTIIKSKGKIIKKYLSNLFPNSKLFNDKKIRTDIPLYEEQILYQIEDFIELLSKTSLDLEVEKEIIFKLRKVINMLNYNKVEFKEEIKSLEYKREIACILNDLNMLYQNNINKNTKKEKFLELKNDVLEQINDVEDKIYVKKRT